MVLLSACHQSMYNSPKYKKPYMKEDSGTLFEDDMVARPRVPNTVSQSQVLADEHFYTGKIDGEFVTEFPYPVDKAMIRRGRDRFNIFCAPCHGRLGNGLGMVQRRGLTPPANYHTDRLRNVEVGYIFDVITNGYRNMYPYGPKIPPEDRWAIIAYVRTLQLSQSATCDDVPEGVPFKSECQ
jgi:mono/diheme cytochrome c family protein